MPGVVPSGILCIFMYVLLPGNMKLKLPVIEQSFFTLSYLLAHLGLTLYYIVSTPLLLVKIKQTWNINK